MTMPHLMNCEHQGEGWCLHCVNNLYLQPGAAEAWSVRCTELVCDLETRYADLESRRKAINRAISDLRKVSDELDMDGQRLFLKIEEAKSHTKKLNDDSGKIILN